MASTRLVLEGSGGEFSQGAEHPRLRPGDVVVAQVQRRLGDGRYRLTAGNRSFTIQTGESLADREVLQLRVRSVSPRLAFAMESRHGRGAVIRPGPDRVPPEGRPRDQLLRDALLSSLPGSRRALVEDFVAGAHGQLRASAPAVSIARHFLAAGIVPDTETVQELARQLFREPRGAEVPGGAVGQDPGLASRFLLEVVRALVGSADAYPEVLARSLEQRLVTLLQGRPELRAFDAAILALDRHLTTLSTAAAIPSLGNLLADGLSLLERTRGGPDPVLGQEIDAALAAGDASRLRSLYLLLASELLGATSVAVDAAPGGGGTTVTGGPAVLNELLAWFRGGPFEFPALGTGGAPEGPAPSDPAGLRALLVALKGDVLRRLGDGGAGVESGDREATLARLWASVRDVVEALRSGPVSQGRGLPDLERALSRGEFEELRQAMERAEGRHMDRIPEIASMREAMRSAFSPARLSAQEILNALGRFGDPPFFYTEMPVALGGDIVPVRLKVAFRRSRPGRRGRDVRRIVIDLVLSRIGRVIGEINVDGRQLGVAFHLRDRDTRELFEGQRVTLEEALRELGFRPRVSLRSERPIHPLLEDTQPLVLDGADLDVVV